MDRLVRSDFTRHSLVVPHAQKLLPLGLGPVGEAVVANIEILAVVGLIELVDEVVRLEPPRVAEVELLNTCEGLAVLRDPVYKSNCIGRGGVEAKDTSDEGQ